MIELRQRRWPFTNGDNSNLFFWWRRGAVSRNSLPLSSTGTKDPCPSEGPESLCLYLSQNIASPWVLTFCQPPGVTSRQGKTDRERDRQTEKERQRERQTEKERETEKERDRQRAERQREKERERQRQRERRTQTDRQTDGQGQKESHTDYIKTDELTE